MPSSIAKFAADMHASGRFLRMLLWLSVIVFALQVADSGWHNHELADKKADCVSCHFVGSLPAEVPGATPALLAIFLAVAYVLARQPRYCYVPAPSYLIPSRQAPPVPTRSLSPASPADSA